MNEETKMIMEIVDEEGGGIASAWHDGEEKTPQPNRFRIEWHGFHYGYRLSISGYEGGEVVKAEAYDALREALTQAAETAERASLVQDRSVGIIKQICALIASDLRAALALVDSQQAKGE